ncbi:MAG: DnaD domain protein, partial [Hyphomonadaceae bacterium]|nr:DnaD domain protein [Clostridia bacterium]
KVAIQWADEGLITTQKVETYLKQREQKGKQDRKMQKILGIADRALTPTEKKYLHTWLEEWAMRAELIEKAYHLTIDRTGKLAFAYMNKILDSWHQAGIQTVAQAEQEKQTYTNQTAQGKSTKPVTIISEFEQKSMQAFLKKYQKSGGS